MSFRVESKRKPPASLVKRGVLRAVEILPTAEPCTVSHAGRVLGNLFRRELYERLALKPLPAKDDAA